VSLTNRNPARLEHARALGFNSVGTSASHIPDAPEKGYDKVVDATGATAVVEQAINDVRKGGTLMIVGVTPPGETIAFEPFRIYNEEISIVGSMAILASYERAVQAIVDGVIDSDNMVTGVFGLEQFTEALEVVRHGSGIKTQVVPTITDERRSGDSA
jgi:threonine dehydrogenase-like Zn-dependent dehydrogenase